LYSNRTRITKTNHWYIILYELRGFNLVILVFRTPYSANIRGQVSCVYQNGNATRAYVNVYIYIHTHTHSEIVWKNSSYLCSTQMFLAKCFFLQIPESPRTNFKTMSHVFGTNPPGKRTASAVTGLYNNILIL
jgi:hypothetical protein